VACTANKRKTLRGGRVVIVLKEVFESRYSCLAEGKSLFIKSCLMEKVHFKVVKFV
jgi:hypothetical protein